MKFTSAIAIAVVSVTAALPMTSMAQSKKERDHRQGQKNQWRNLAIGSGALGLFGLLKHDNTLMFAGAAGALYSANRYEQDRKSQSNSDRARAQYFSKRSFTRNGTRYDRKTVKKNGHTYYQFVKHRG